MQSAVTRVVFTAAADGDRLDRALAAALPELSRSRIKVLIEAGHVTLADAESEAPRTISEPSTRVKSGQVADVAVPAPTPAKPVAQAMALDVVYEDADLIVIDKPAGLVVHPAAGNPDRTLVNALIAHCGDSLSGIGGERRPGIVHRLDKDTSGLIVAAKTDQAHNALAAQFAEHSIDRAYHAVLWGVPSPREGRIEGNIGRSTRDRKKMAVVTRGGRPAATRYRVLRPLGAAASLVECRLETGRTHQIRVHMAAIGNPVIGDPLYGRITSARGAKLPESRRKPVRAFGRQALHAVLIGFDHPTTKKRLHFECDLPPDIRELMGTLESV